MIVKKKMQRIALVVFSLFFCKEMHAISSLANNDPYPIYSTVYDPLLTTWRKQWIKGCNDDCFARESFSFAVTPFWQKATRGRTFGHEKALLGDLQGPWNMLALLYGNLPSGADLTGKQLGYAKASIFSNFYTAAPECPPNQNQIFSDSNATTQKYMLNDEAELIGYFSVPIKYKKVGTRFELSFSPIEDLGFTMQAGITEIRQTVTHFIDRGAVGGVECPNESGTFESCPNEFCELIPVLNNLAGPNCYATCNEASPTTDTCTTPSCQINEQLMQTNKAQLIFKEIGLDSCDFEETSFEDIRFIGWWRHIFSINEQRDPCCWPGVLLVPSIEVHAIVPTAKKKNRVKMFSVPFGNDGHMAVGFDAGLQMDFVETVEIAFKIGMTHFFEKSHANYRLPTDIHQSGIYPFATDVKVTPGNNFNFNAAISAYHFIDHLSAWAEYVMVKHEQDKLALVTPDDAFIPKQAACLTKFVSQFINAAVNYDISPNLSIGFMGQFPVAQRNAYRSTSYYGTFRLVF